MWLRAVRTVEHRRRTGRKLALQQLGALMGIDWTIVQKVETGIRAVDADFVIAAINALRTLGYNYEVSEALQRAGLPPLPNGGRGVVMQHGPAGEAAQLGLFGAGLGGAPATRHNTEADNDDFARMVDEILRTARAGGDTDKLIQELYDIAASDTISNETRRYLLAHIRMVRKAIADDADSHRTGAHGAPGETALAHSTA